MGDQGDGGNCRGASGEPGTCSAPGGCMMAEWIVCRKERSERARDAVRALAEDLANGRDASESEADLLEAVADRAFAAAPGPISRNPVDRLLSTWVSDLLWEEARIRSAEAMPVYGGHSPSLPKGWKDWKEVRDALLVEAGHFTATDSEEFAAEALCRLLDQLRRGHQVRYPRAWARKVFASLASATGRRKARNPLPPENLPHNHTVGELRSGKTTPSAAYQVACRELAVYYLCQLPQPYRQIACWESCGLPPADSILLLRKWRPIGISAARKLILRTREMLRSLGKGQNLREVWPRRFSEKSPWRRVNPPSILTLRGRKSMRRSQTASGARTGSTTRSGALAYAEGLNGYGAARWSDSRDFIRNSQ